VVFVAEEDFLEGLAVEGEKTVVAELSLAPVPARCCLPTGQGDSSFYLQPGLCANALHEQDKKSKKAKVGANSVKASPFREKCGGRVVVGSRSRIQQ
jgi:hypothetical protein